MRKLTLNLEALAVESFEAATETRPAGTVHGAEMISENPMSCFGCNSLNGTCQHNTQCCPVTQ